MSSFSWDSFDDSSLSLSFSFSISLLISLSDSLLLESVMFSFLLDWLFVFSFSFLSLNFDISNLSLGSSIGIISGLSEFVFVEISLGSSSGLFCSEILLSWSWAVLDGELLLMLSETSGSWKSSKLKRSSSAINNSIILNIFLI